jgi:hypothetical protein
MLSLIVSFMLEWETLFAQRRSAHRAIRLALAHSCVLGRRTIARAFLVRLPHGDWSGDYKLFSRSTWQAQDLFTPVLKQAIALCPGRLLPLATDDTRLPKSGKKVAGAHWGRHPLSPPFHLNLQFGLRYLHTAVLLPLHATDAVSARALPVWFEEVTPVRKPGKNATPEDLQAYRQAVKVNNLSQRAVEMMRQLRRRVDAAGAADKVLVFALDGSYCNQTVFTAELERTVLMARARKDAKLCFAAEGGRRWYGEEKFTPEQVRQDEGRAWQEVELFHGGKRREVAYKEVKEVLWQRGAGRKRLRLLVVRPTAYRKTKQGRLLYRQAACLLTTDLTSEAGELLQIYFDRWQIEVSHREMKQSGGLGQAQVRVSRSVERQPALTAATYSVVQLAALRRYGAKRGEEFEELPKYQRERSRVSYQEMIRKLRSEVVEQGEELPVGLKITEKSLLAAATV